MVREECPGVDGESALLCEVGEARDEILPVGLIRENDASLEPPHHHVVEPVGRIQADLAGHGGEQHGRQRIEQQRPGLRIT